MRREGKLINIIYTLCPIVREEELQLWQRLDVGGEIQTVQFPGRRRILWVRESETAIALRRKEHLLADRGLINDWCGYLSSLEYATGEAMKMARKLELAGNLRLDCDLTIRERPVLPDESRDGLTWNADAHRRRYVEVPRGWLRSPIKPYRELRPISGPTVTAWATNRAEDPKED